MSAQPQDPNGEGTISTNEALLRHNEMVRPPAIEDPLRMDLTVEECDQAWAIRRAIEAIPEIDNLSDFWYCQLAMIVGDNVEEAVRRAQHLQTFREEYGVLDNEADGRRALTALLELAPEYFIAMNFHEDAYSMALNVKGFNPSSLNTPQRERSWFMGYYYLQQCLSPDFETIRQGVIFHIECNGYDWKKHVDIKLFGRLCDAYHSSYPQRLAAKHYHTGVMFNVLYSMVKKVYSEEIVKDFQVGCQAPAYLDEIYLQPSPEAAKQRTLSRMNNSLRLRYKNEREFSLEAFTASLPPDEDDGEGDY